MLLLHDDDNTFHMNYLVQKITKPHYATCGSYKGQASPLALSVGDCVFQVPLHPLLTPQLQPSVNQKGREGVSGMRCCKVLETKLLITTICVQAEPPPAPQLPSLTMSCLRLGVLCFRFISFPYLRMEMYPGTPAKTSKFITMLMTASRMLSEFCFPPQLLLLPKPVELQDPADYRDCYLHMKNGSGRKCN